MAYTPENNPYIPGDPYSYDLKWIVDKMKTYEEPQKYAEQAAQSALEASDSAVLANQAKANAVSAQHAAENAAAPGGTSDT